MTNPRKRVLIFPGTTLVGIEILRSLQSLPGFDLRGAGSDVAAGHLAGFTNFDLLPHVEAHNFFAELRALLKREAIDYLYPANDLALSVLAEAEFDGFSLVAHPVSTVRIAASKIATHTRFLADRITPLRFTAEPEAAAFPLFSKPDVGHSSIGAEVVTGPDALRELVASHQNFWDTHLVTELLVTDEVTVDCFSTADQGLLYSAARTRDLREGGIATVTADYEDPQLSEMAALIGGRLTFNGPWFFQAKRDIAGDFRLMEIGARLAGASAIRRAQGVNLPQLAILAADNEPVSVYPSRFTLVSRRIDGVSQVTSEERFSSLYVDLDDTLILNGAVNREVEALARHVAGLGLPVAVITRHRFDPLATLQEFGLEGIFADVFHTTQGEPKSAFITGGGNSVLIDDSFSERISCLSHPNILAVDASCATQIRGLFDDTQ